MQVKAAAVQLSGMLYGRKGTIETVVEPSSIGAMGGDAVFRNGGCRHE